MKQQNEKQLNYLEFKRKENLEFEKNKKQIIKLEQNHRNTFRTYLMTQFKMD